MEWLTSATTGVVSVMNSCFTVITENATLALIFTGTVILPIGISLIHKFRKKA